MEHLIIGTSGHIDHGKTALIKALTGRNLDSLKEEKERGITIDLGFTWIDLSPELRAGIIDVPGHEKFLPNMVSGVSGMDIVLLVIALDEGVMPQTIEHLDVLKELNVKKGFVVLTKLDMVDSDYALLMEEEVRKDLQGTVAESWPAFKVSSYTGEGIDELKKSLCDFVVKTTHERDISGHFRMPIDRVIPIKGLGTVVAGTVLEGALSPGTEIQIYPGETITKVKSIQSHEVDVDYVVAGQRAALLLSGVKKEEVHRGMVVSLPSIITPTNRIDVKLSNDSHADRIIKNQSRVHLHIGAKEVIARVVLLDKDQLSKKEEGFAELVTETEIAVKRGDRFVIRFLSPLETIGGGVIIDANASKKKRNDEATIELLRLKADDSFEKAILKIVLEETMPISKKNLLKKSELEEEQLDKIMNKICENILVVNTKREIFYWSILESDRKIIEIKEHFAKISEEHKYRLSIKKSDFRVKFYRGFENQACDAHIDYLAQNGIISVLGEEVYFKDIYDDDLIDDTYNRTVTYLRKKLGEAGTNFVDILAIKPKSISEEDYLDLVHLFVKKGIIIQINDDYYTTPEIKNLIVTKVEDFFENNEVISFASLRDILDTSRKSAKPLMAYLDEVGITKWCGKETERVRK